jgi:dTDP-4-amino-4,6-dideoxygalactose transaminase
MRKDFLIFGSPQIGEEEINEVVATLRSGWLGTGPKTHKFEEDFKQCTGAAHALAVSSCTAALHLALKVLDIGPGDEVIVPAMTFAATANVVIHCGAKPVFADCVLSTMNIDPQDIERKLTKRTKAIIVVHMAGRACDMDAIMKIARKHKLKVIEDCAHAVETQYKGRKVGTIGDMGCYSFYSIKNVVTVEGGMLTTNKESYARHARVLSLHGMSKDAWDRYGKSGYKHYQVVEAGFKYNMPDILASIGIHQLARVDKNWERRDEIWHRYNAELAGMPLLLPAPIEKGDRHAHHLYTILVDPSKTKITRDEFLNEMTKRNIGTGVHFQALHLQPFYKKLFKYKKGDLPNTESIGARPVSIPLSAKLTDEDVTDVIAAIKDVFA